MSGASEVPAIPEDVRKLVERLRNWSDAAGSELSASSMMPAHIAGVGDKTAGELIKAAREAADRLARPVDTGRENTP